MKLRDIPIVTVGPGSQPADQDGTQLEYIAMPSDMSTYRRPDIPALETITDLTGAREAMAWLQHALESYDLNAKPAAADLTRLDAGNRDLVNQILGEGEVSVKYSGAVRGRIQESLLAGVWRALYLDEEDRITHDMLEVGDVPGLARILADQCPVSMSELARADAPPSVMNARSILTELAAQCQAYQTDGTAHVVNLSLLPLSDEDLAFLDDTLGRGPVDILSRSYGKCQITSTLAPNVWWVRFYNSMSTLLLNSLEVVDVPLVACAAPEDIADSRNRLREIMDSYGNEMS